MRISQFTFFLFFVLQALLVSTTVFAEEKSQPTEFLEITETPAGTIARTTQGGIVYLPKSDEKTRAFLAGKGDAPADLISLVTPRSATPNCSLAKGGAVPLSARGGVVVTKLLDRMKHGFDSRLQSIVASPLSSTLTAAALSLNDSGTADSANCSSRLFAQANALSLFISRRETVAYLRCQLVGGRPTQTDESRGAVYQMMEMQWAEGEALDRVLKERFRRNPSSVCPSSRADWDGLMMGWALASTIDFFEGCERDSGELGICLETPPPSPIPAALAATQAAPTPPPSPAPTAAEPAATATPVAGAASAPGAPSVERATSATTAPVAVPAAAAEEKATAETATPPPSPSLPPSPIPAAP